MPDLTKKIPDSIANETELEGDSLDDFSFLKEDFADEERSELDVALQTEEDLRFGEGEEEEEIELEEDVELEEEEEIEEEIDPEIEEEEIKEVEEELEQEEEELFYDPERDFPDMENTSPNVFKDLNAARLGLIAKGSYIDELIGELKERGSGVGAIELPEHLQGNLEEIGNRFSLDAVSEIDSDGTKKAIAESDVFINNLKDKVARVKTEQQTSQAITNAQETLQKANVEMTQILTKVGFTQKELNEIDNDEAVFQRIDSQIEDLESRADEIISDRGYQKFSEQLSGLQSVKSRLQALVDETASALEQQQKHIPQEQRVTPEMEEAAIQEFEQDQPNNWILKDKTGNTKEAFVRTARASGWDLSSARAVAESAQKFKAKVQSLAVNKLPKHNQQKKTQSKDKSSRQIRRVKPKVQVQQRKGERIDNVLDRDLEHFMETELFDE